VITRAEIQRLARQGRVDERTQERDYVLTWLLAGMAGQPFDLVFKGGTCLRRCYIPGYRYSEDLDFTLPPDSPPIAAVDAASTWCAWIAEQAGIRAEAEQDESLAGRRAWVSFTGPLGATRGRAIKVDVATDEVVVGHVEQRPLLSEYSDLDSGAYAVPSYSLAEIWAEKTRSVMQRAEPRDLYDLAALAELSGDVPRAAIGLFEAKVRAKGLNPEDLGARLDARELTLRRRWGERLHDQVADVPPFEATWRAVRRALRQAGYLV
jgi:uncharacterized protein